MDLARTELAPQHAPLPRWLEWLYKSRSKGDKARRIFHFYQRSGLQGFVRKSGVLRSLNLQRLDALLPEAVSNAAIKDFYPAHGTTKGTVSLFTGCAGNVLDRTTIIAACELLAAAGYAVRVPPQQVCCGALPMHSGQSETATQLARENAAAFAGNDAVLYVATGCGASLSEYGKTETLPRDDPGIASLGQRAQEICSFLVQSGALTTDLFAPLVARAALHTPCTMRNVVKQGERVAQLLALLPGLQLTKLGTAPGCCGAGGVHLAQDSPTNRALRQETIEAVTRSAPAILLTTNLGCALNLRAELAMQGLAIGVMHPIVLLRQQLRVTPP